MPLEVQSRKKGGRGSLEKNLTPLIAAVVLVGSKACKNTGKKGVKLS